MNYDRINWENAPSTDTPLDADNLNKMDEALDTLNREVAKTRSDVQEVEETAASLGSQIAGIIRLEDGSTTGDAELINGRVGKDGTTYDTIGDAIRGQIGDLRDNVIEVSDEEPEEFYNKIWVKDDGQEIEIPTKAELDAVEDEVDELNERMDNLKPGLSDEAKIALLACFENVAWIDAQGQTYYDNLEAALYADEYPKITATFAPGTNTIYTDDAINDLKQYLTVKYYATKLSTGVVVASNDYTLSGTLVEGENVIRAEYNNLSTTFIVNAVDYYNQPYWSVADGSLGISLGSFSNTKFNNHELWWNVDGETPAQAYIDNFRLIYAKRGEYIYREQSNMHPIPIPSGAKTVSVTITPSTAYIRALPCYCVNNQWFNTGTWGSIAWGQGVCNANIPSMDVPLYLIVYCKHESAGNGGSPFPEGEPSEITVTFGFEEGE